MAKRKRGHRPGHHPDRGDTVTRGVPALTSTMERNLKVEKRKKKRRKLREQAEDDSRVKLDALVVKALKKKLKTQVRTALKPVSRALGHDTRKDEARRVQRMRRRRSLTLRNVSLGDGGDQRLADFLRQMPNLRRFTLTGKVRKMGVQAPSKTWFRDAFQQHSQLKVVNIDSHSLELLSHQSCTRLVKRLDLITVLLADQTPSRTKCHVSASSPLATEVRYLRKAAKSLVVYGRYLLVSVDRTFDYWLRVSGQLRSSILLLPHAYSMTDDSLKLRDSIVGAGASLMTQQDDSTGRLLWPDLVVADCPFSSCVDFKQQQMGIHVQLPYSRSSPHWPKGL